MASFKFKGPCALFSSLCYWIPSHINGFFKTIVLIGYVNCVFMFSPLFSYVGFVYIAPVRGKCSLFFFYLLVKEEDMFPPIFTFLYIPYVLFVIYFHYLFFTYTRTLYNNNGGSLYTTKKHVNCLWPVLLTIISNVDF